MATNLNECFGIELMDFISSHVNNDSCVDRGVMQSHTDGKVKGCVIVQQRKKVKYPFKSVLFGSLIISSIRMCSHTF